MTSDQPWDLFLAHAGPDGPLAEHLFNLLSPPLRVFLDSKGIKLGDNWDGTLGAAQQNSLCTVVLVSHLTEEAYYQREEIANAIAMARKDPESHRVVPIYLTAEGEQAAIPYGLRLKHGLTLSDTVTLSDAATRLIELVQGLRPGTAAQSLVATIPGARAGLLHAPPASWVSPASKNKRRYKVVAFDLDGTLLRGKDFIFSWERVWADLGVSKSVQRSLRNEYKLRSETAATPQERAAAYRRWCEAAVSHFKARGLTRARLAEIAAPLELTANCREALTALRAEGVVTAIFSGGISTFLEDRFGDFRDYVDFVFVNELRFDANGVIDSVLATSYDFEGKAEALSLVCSLAKCTRDEAVFVGDRFNDEAIMLHAHLAIAYPPGDKIVDDAARIPIDQDDLRLILPHVLVD